MVETKPISANSGKILDFLKGNAGSEFTTKQISSALDIKCVIGSLNSFVKKGYVTKSETVPDAEGKVYKTYAITQEGLNWNPEVEAE